MAQNLDPLPSVTSFLTRCFAQVRVALAAGWVLAATEAYAAPPTVLTWSGSRSTAWNEISANWVRNGTTASFQTGDHVVFGDRPARSNVVIATPGVQVGSLFVSNRTTAYTFSGGPILGSGPFLKAESAALTLLNVSQHTGPTRLLDGLIVLADNAGFEASPEITLGPTAVLDVFLRTDGRLNLGSHQVLTGSGSVNGDVVVAGTLAPGLDGIGALTTGTQIWPSGGTLRWEIASVTGDAGEQWDSLVITDSLAVQATSAQPFQIQLVTINAVGIGPLPVFDPNRPYSWPIAEVYGGLVQYAPERIRIDVSEFHNDSAGGRFILDPASPRLRFLPNQPPLVNSFSLARVPNQPFAIHIPTLLALHAIDPDGDTIRLQTVSALSRLGVPLRIVGDQLLYNTSLNADDSFEYVVRDVRDYRPGDTVRTGAAKVNLHVMTPTDPPLAFNPPQIRDGRVRLQLRGLPGFTYSVQRSPNPDPGQPWTTLANLRAGTLGQIEFWDYNPPPGAAFYRAVQQ